jgi:hypothetical protein
VPKRKILKEKRKKRTKEKMEKTEKKERKREKENLLTLPVLLSPNTLTK